MNKRVLITGGVGFIGSHLVEFLLQNNYSISIVDDLSSESAVNFRQDIHFVKVDICSIEDMNNVFLETRPCAVIHLASMNSVTTSISDPIKDLNVNVAGTLNLLNLCVRYNVKKFVYSSSASVYGNPDKVPIKEDCTSEPISPYGLSKKTSEKYIEMYGKLYGLSYSILRFANVYGPRQAISKESGVISLFINSIINGSQPIIYGAGKQTRDFIYVSDVIKTIYYSLHSSKSDIYNVSNNIEISIGNILEILCNLAGVPCSPIYYPAKKGDINRSILDNSRVKKDLSWQPEIDIEKGLYHTLDYYKVHK